MRGIKRERIIEAVQRLARRIRGELTLRALHKHEGITPRQVSYRFPEGWFGLLEAAKLGARGTRQRRTTDAELLRDFDAVVRRLKRLPTWREVRRSCRCSPALYQARFGSHEGTVARWRAWAERSDGLLARVAPARRGKRKSRELDYGEIVGMSGLGFAPLNELGVVHAFGVLSERLGYSVVKMRAAFPDCEAMRRVPGHEGRWERVRIEFEFRSSNFERHGHDANGCDVIVCWEHDWAQCPVEVVELKKEVGRLRREG